MAKTGGLYEETPRMERDEKGKVGVKKAEKKADEHEGADSASSSLSVHERHVNERREMKHRHINEHLALHHKHEVEHSHHKGDKAEMHMRHLSELKELHKKHEGETKSMHEKYMKEESQDDSGKMVGKSGKTMINKVENDGEGEE